MIRVGFAMTGSFCTFSEVIPQIEALAASGYDVTPIMSDTAYSTDTRFGTATEHTERLRAITGKEIIHTIKDAEPIGPKKLLDILVVAPCTGNTLAKLNCGITDTSVTMACKAHLRNGRPLLLGVSTNDALSGSGKNIGGLLNSKNVFFIPFGQDNSEKKPTSEVADFSQLQKALEAALRGEQLQPMIISK